MTGQQSPEQAAKGYDAALVQAVGAKNVTKAK
jgi:hypothetical protein